MSVFIGSSEISSVFVGSDEVQEIWVGGTQVWTNLPDITPGSYALEEIGNSALFGFLIDPAQTSTSLTLRHGFYNSGGFFLITQRATLNFTLKAGSYRLHYTIASESGHPDGNRSTLNTSITGTGTTNTSTTLVDGSTLSVGAKTWDFTQNSEGTVTLRWTTGMNTSGASGTDDRFVTINNIYLEKL